MFIYMFTALNIFKKAGHMKTFVIIIVIITSKFHQQFVNWNNWIIDQ